MPVSIHLRGPEVRLSEIEQAVEVVFADLVWVEQVFSVYRADSDISRLRRGEAQLNDCAPEVAQVLDLCQEASLLTRGAFAWRLPDQDGRVLVEPTGLVKGWALERAAVRLEALDGHAYCVNAGGDIAVGGRNAGAEADRPWRLGIEDPHDRSRVAHLVELGHGGLATSGTAARGAHIIDPVTGGASIRTGSVSVIAPSIMWADVWATALFVGPNDLDEVFPKVAGWRFIRQ